MKIFSRREFSRISLMAVVGGVGMFSGLGGALAAEKVNSKVKGVQIGLNVPYSFGKGEMPAEEILKNCVALGVSGVELRLQPVEVFMGAPADFVFPKKVEAAKGADAAGKTKATGETKANAEAASKGMADWRKAAPMAKVKEFRRMYKSGGVLIEILKVDGIFKMSDAELDYVFTVAKALGARALSTEISNKEEDLKRVGSFADKHRMLIGYHGHAATGPEHWEKAFALAKYNGANVDIGHFVAGNHGSPVEFLKAHHDRVTHVHIKDRKRNNGANTPFGEGETPIVEVLRLIRDNKWKIQATIEFEYKVPADSDRMTEIGKAVKYCRDALMG
jgi:sugar phosphate isomerase/epimerase